MWFLVREDGLELRRREIGLQAHGEQEARTQESDNRGFEHARRGIRADTRQRHDMSDIGMAACRS